MRKPLKTPRFIVGLGASAGGLEALERFFDGAPIDSGGAFVVVMHLSRDFKSMLDELLSRHTKMPVCVAENNTKLQANTVYIIQPDSNITVTRTHIKTANRPSIEASGPAASIDTLFHSIAKYWFKNGAAIVLSGSGSDGASGIESVFENNGFTCAQAPETAKFDSMPVAAITTGKVKAVEAPEQLAETVIDGVIWQAEIPEAPIPSDNDSALRQILDAVVGVANLDVSQYKHSTFERRVRRRMMDLQLGSLQAYSAYITENIDEAQKFSETLLIGVTQFFRDSEAFSLIRRQVIPEIIRVAHEENRPIRIWIPGCATGEEPYTMALLFAEALHDMPYKIEVQIFASDISREYLAIAGRGEYSAEQLKDVPEPLRSRYFTNISNDGKDRWLVHSDIRKMIVFAPHDLLSDPPFTRLDMVSCRNILIYFSVEAQQRILSSFAFGLRERGFLFLGSSETVGAQRKAFEFIDARNRIFRRGDTKNSVLSLSSTTERIIRGNRSLGHAKASSRLRETALQPAYAMLLRDYAPASLLISAEKELLHSFGDARRYLRPPEGVSHFDVSQMVDPALKTPLLAGIERAVRDKKPITFSRIILGSFPEEDMVVDLTIQPMVNETEDQVEYVIALINDEKYAVEKEKEDLPASPTLIDAKQISNERVEELETELGRTREALQSTIEEIETTNEELQATNEELMSANEELQSTNEELSSVNEELYSVNAEYHRQNEELNQLSSDFDQLLHATEIGVVFLDQDNQITRFTSQAGKLLTLTDTDIGRPLSNYRSPFVDLDPTELAAKALKQGEPLEEETLDQQGQTWLIRAVTEEFHNGAILLLININRLREAERETKRATEKLEAIRNATKSFYLVLDRTGTKIVDDQGWKEFVGIDDTKTPVPFNGKFVHSEDIEIARSVFENRHKQTEGTFHVRSWHDASKSYHYIKVSYRLLENKNLQMIAVDVDELFRGKLQIEERSAILDATMRNSSSILAYVGNDLKYRVTNEAYNRLLGLGDRDVSGLPINEVLDPEVYKKIQPGIERVLNGEPVEATLPLGTGQEKRLYALKMQPVLGKDSKPIGYVVTGLELSHYSELSRDIHDSEKLIINATINSDQAVMTVDVDNGKVEFANEQALKKLGISDSRELENGIKVSRITPQLTDKSWSKKLSSLSPNSEEMDSSVMVFDTASTTVEADLITTVFEDENKKKKAVIRVFENPEKARLLDDLRLRSEELAVSNRELEQFTSVVAHDLRTPVRHILQFTQILDQQDNNLSKEQIAENINIIANSATNMSNMVNGLLNYSRLGRGGGSFQPVELNNVVETALAQLKTEIESYGAVIKVGELPTVDGEPELLVELVQNLISNAFKYRKPDSNPHITIDSKNDKNKCAIRFTDEGIGIATEQREGVFQLFKRLHAEEDIPGLGIGLTACRRIAEIHDSIIELDKKYHKGARFILTMPLPVKVAKEREKDRAIA